MENLENIKKTEDAISEAESLLGGLSVEEAIAAEERDIENEERVASYLRVLEAEFGKYHEIVLRGRTVSMKVSYDTRYSVFFMKHEDGKIEELEPDAMKAFMMEDEYQIGSLDASIDAVDSSENNAKSADSMATVDTAVDASTANKSDAYVDSVIEIENTSQENQNSKKDNALGIERNGVLGGKEDKEKTKTELPSIEAVGVTTYVLPDSFKLKNPKLQEFLDNKSLQGKRSDDEFNALKADIMQAAARVVEGEDVDLVVSDLKLNNSTKVSKTMSKELPVLLRAEVLAHTDSATNTDSATPEIQSLPAEQEIQASPIEKQQAPLGEVSEEKVTINNEHKESVDAVEVDDSLNRIIRIEDAPITNALIEKVKNESASEHAVDRVGVLKELEIKLINVRNSYAQEDYKKTTAWDNLKRFFGRSLSKDEDEGVVYKKSEYQKALTDFIEAKLQFARESSSTDVELKASLVEVLKDVEISERMHLYDARTDAKIPPKLLTKIQGSLDWYRDLSFGQKIAFSAVMFGAGAGLGLSGGAGAAGALFFAKRVFGGAVAGRGVYEALETASQERATLNQEASVAAVQREMLDMETPEQLMERLQIRIQESIASADTALNDGLKNRLRSSVAGYATAAFFGSGFPSIVAEKINAMWAMSESVSMKLPVFPQESLSDSLPDSTVANALHPEAAVQVTENVFQNQSDVSSEAISRIAHEAVPTPLVDLRIAAGSGESIEGQLVKHLVSGGQSTEEAGKMAHRMFLDFAHDKGVSAEEYNTIASGNITFDPETLHIKDIVTTPLENHEVPTNSQAMHSRMFLPEATPTDSVSRELNAALPIESAIAEVSATESREVAADLVKSLSGNNRELWQQLKTMSVAEIQKDTSGKYDGTRAFIIQYLKEHGEKLTSKMRKGSVLSFVAEHAKLGKRI